MKQSNIDLLQRYSFATNTTPECDDGWFQLIQSLYKQIEALKPPSHLKITQIKEKFGYLRVYYDIQREKSDKNEIETICYLLDILIEVAENASAYICEVCGKSGERRKKGYYRLKTLCNECDRELP